jgi:hypothetical protein
MSKPAAQIHRYEMPVTPAAAAPVTKVSQAIRRSVAAPGALSTGACFGWN